jgi:exodeoxyribonuclease V alpha subunit
MELMMNQDNDALFPANFSDINGSQDFESYQAWANLQSDAAEQAIEDLIMSSESEAFLDLQSMVRPEALAPAHDENNSLVDAEPAYEFPFSRLDKALADFLQMSQPSELTEHYLLACMVSYQYSRGHACLDLAALEKRPLLTLGLEAKAKDLIPKNLKELAQTCPWTQGDNSPLVLLNHKLYLRRNFYAENLIKSTIQQRLKPIDFSAIEEDILTKTLNDLFANNQTDSSQVDWQKVACAIASRAHFTIITGGPGTGKTTTVTKLLALLLDQAKRHNKVLKIALAAPTGKAAARLNESMQNALAKLPEHLQFASDVLSSAQTLHKLLEINPYKTQYQVPELAFDIVLVDEASMIDLQMMARLMLAVPPHAKLILLGDKDQLASVEAGAVMGQLCTRAEFGFYSEQSVAWIKKITGQNIDKRRAYKAANADALSQQTVMLSHSYRFTANSKIGKISKAINKGESFDLNELQEQGQSAHDKIVVYKPSQARNAELIDLFKNAWHEWLSQLKPYLAKSTDALTECQDEVAIQLLKAFSQFQVLCAVREGSWGVHNFNRIIAQGLGFPNTPWFVGRPVMVTQNNYYLKLMNGDIGLCLPKDGTLKVAFLTSNNTIQWVLPSRLEAVESVFAMTVHKSQGSEFNQVCLVLPDKNSLVLNKELLYTGITRAKTVLHLVLPNEAVFTNALQFKVNRSGGLNLN